MNLFLELQDSRGELNDKPFIVEARHTNEFDIKQARLALAWSRTLGLEIPTDLELGRFTMDLGRRRLCARNRMRNTTNAFDGLRWRFGRQSQWQLISFLSRPVELKPGGLDSSDNRRFFWGVHFENQLRPRWLYDAYYLGYHESARTLTQRRYTTLGVRVYRPSSPGVVDYELESDWQFGSAQGHGHFAHHQHAELGYATHSWWSSRWSLHYDYASGDEDPEDNRSGGFNTLFGARRFELCPTGIYGPFFRSNLNTPGLRWVMSPGRMGELMASYRILWLAEARDAWTGSGLQDPSGQSGTFLGSHLEVRWRGRPAETLLVEAGYAHFFKGSYLDRVPLSPRTADSDYLYLGIELHAQLLSR